MRNIITVKAQDKSTVRFLDKAIGSGTMKDVYPSQDKSHVVAFFRQPLEAAAMERLKVITGTYREKIFGQVGGDYWKNLFCWPEKIVQWDGRTGIVCPAYQQSFFFGKGSTFQGKEKEGKWFASAKLRNRFLPPNEKGDWLRYFHICIQIARAVRRLHAAGLAHSDLSYKNVLVDPLQGRATIIDIDSLVVPGKFPPDVLGTPDFVAPEVLATRILPAGDANKQLPCIATDRHALAVLVYMYLLYRHPLRGGKIHQLDVGKDEELAMGAKALFIEHPTDASNRPKTSQMSKYELPEGDVEKLPYTVCGPYLKELFGRAFITGLHAPKERPSAMDWEMALAKTTDLMLPCQNPACGRRWLVFSGGKKPRCPFCGAPYRSQLPVLNFHYAHENGKLMQENYRLAVYDKQSLYLWHTSRDILPNEKIRPEDRKPVGDFHFYKGRWILINRRLPSLYDKDEDRKISIGEYVELTAGKRILLSAQNGGRLAVVAFVQG